MAESFLTSIVYAMINVLALSLSSESGESRKGTNVAIASRSPFRRN
jgi:hypothetical protein